MLEAIDITIRYGSRVAVAGVSLKLNAGEVTAIIGPNGAGKSTMLRALNGAHKPTAEKSSSTGCRWDITAAALSADALRPFLRKPICGFPLRSRVCFWAAAMHGPAPVHGDGRLRVTLRLPRPFCSETELEELAGAYHERAFRGERQRAVLARALATGGGNLLLDDLPRISTWVIRRRSFPGPRVAVIGVVLVRRAVTMTSTLRLSLPIAYSS